MKDMLGREAIMRADKALERFISQNVRPFGVLEIDYLGVTIFGIHMETKHFIKIES